MSQIQTISLYQPWSSLWVSGLKKAETRGWCYRGQLPCVLAVHAAKKDVSIPDSPGKRVLADALARLGCPVIHGARGVVIGTGNLHRGKLLGLVRLVACVRTEAILSGREDRWQYLLTERELACGDFSYGRWAWVADCFYQFPEPIPCVGRRYVWEWKDPTEEATNIAREWLEEVSHAPP